MDKLEGYLVSIKESLDDKFEGRGKQSVSIIVTILSVVLTGLLGLLAHIVFK
jgi:DNA-directed RNA polymerase subunit E'/Rpb7